MVLILDGNSEIGAQLSRDQRYWICSRQLIRVRAFTNRFFSSEKTYFPSCMRNLFWITILYSSSMGRVIIFNLRYQVAVVKRLNWL